MDAKQLFPKTHALYSQGKITKEQLPDVALEEANDRCEKSYKTKLFFLNLLRFGTGAFGYSATGIVGASALVPLFLSIGPMASNAQAYVKWLYGGSLAFGVVGLGLTSYYIGKLTHEILKAISKKINLLKGIEKIDPETAVKLFIQEINQE